MKFFETLHRLRFLVLGIVLAIGVGFYNPEKPATKKDQVILNLVYNVLNSSHFAPQEVNDEFSSRVFDHYLQQLDYSKRFLLQSDVEALEEFRYKLDDEIKSTQLVFFDRALQRYQERFEEVEAFYEELLAEPFDFDLQERFETDEEKLEFAKNRTALQARWRKYFKHRVINRIEDRLYNQEKQREANDSLPDDEQEELKSFTELEAEAREKELELHQDWFKNLRDMEHIDWLGMYINAITNTYDPHTQYFPPQRQEDFEIGMSGQLEGIGAQLSQKGDYVTVSKVITGSPCWKQGDLEVGDKILSVSEADAEEDEEPVDMVGMKVRKAVSYIRGKKGTTVILTVRKMDGTKMDIPIERDVVELESTFAKSAVLGEGEEKVGVIRLPKFYVNFYGEENHDCAEDVKAELEKLKAENVQSVILDLRNNGGGSLQGVIDIVGLFIDEGPVVQVKAPGRRVKVLEDKDSDVAYDGPLVVLVNRFSASASEIFAAAIQDYQRGIIVGSESTFGKGTVQNIVDLDGTVGSSYSEVKPLGALKLTIQKYYRINGGTPQMRGVRPDIVLPDNYMHIPFGEKERDYAMPYDEIEPADYEVWPRAEANLEKLQKASDKRQKSNAKYALMEQYASWIETQRENTVKSLHFETYRQNRKIYRKESERFKDILKSEREIKVTANSADLEEINANEENKAKAEDWHEKLSTDLFLQEAMEVSHDLQTYYNP